MKSDASELLDLSTYTVLVSPTGDILDIRAHHRAGNAEVAKLKGRVYSNECSARYRPAIKGVLNRERSLLSAVMPPPTLGIDAWFAVVGVPLGASPDGGALFIHMDISPWMAKSAGKSVPPKKISMDLLQQAMATTFIGDGPELSRAYTSKNTYDGIESLTARQRQVLELIGTGKTNIEISEALSCSLNTVKRHVTAVLQKLKLPNRTRAAMIAHQLERPSKI
ncbi:response regulator transcription factor [Hyphomicrobium sp.]|jgi:DNA-binding CsgD family transcriptional regulator|uniref:helix-turn-helix transcriptional regulator n=1 Tax=Hyphomicrobium sp. TaxID=82 RepID=UPI00356166D4